MTVIMMDGFDSIGAAPSAALCAERGYASEPVVAPLVATPKHPTPPIKNGLDVLQTVGGRVIYWDDTTYYRLDGSVMPMDEVDSILAEAKGDGAFDKINWDV